MSKFLLFAVFGSILFGNDLREWGAEVEGYRLSIYTPQRTYACGEPVTLKVATKNSAPVDGRHWFTGITAIDFPALILLPTPSWLPFRQTAKLTEEGRKRTDPKRIFGFKSALFPSGSEYQEELDLSTLYEMHWPGEYTITVSKTVRKRYAPGEETLKSNELNVTVEPCKP